MTRPPRCCLRVLAFCVLLASVAGPPAVPASQPPDPVAVGKDHVYIFLLNGTDPLHCGGLPSLGDRLRGLGYSRTFYGGLLQVGPFRRQIEAIHREDPHARFVLIGFSLGANRAYGLAQALRHDGVCIDLLVFLSGNHWLGGLPAERPANVQRVVNVLAGGALGARGERGWAENYRLAEAWHFGTPCSPSTLALLTQLLGEVAGVVTPGHDLGPPHR